MGLKGDVDEVRTAWSSYSKPFRIWLVLSLFLASGSIASLSETVFKWKAFFADALVFYQTWVSQPLYSLLSAVVPFSLSSDIADGLVLLALLLSATARLALTSYPQAGVEIFGILFGFGFIFFKASGPPTRTHFIAAFVIAAVLYSVKYYRAGGAVWRLWLLSLLLPFALVGIAGALNAGIARTS